MPVTFQTTSALSLYVMFNDAADATAVDLTEGTDDLEGVYTVADAAIQSAGLAAGTYSYRILEGAAASKSAGDPLKGTNAEPFRWSGSAELYAAADTLAISGDSTAADNLEAAADGTGFNLGGGAIVATSVTNNVTLADGYLTAAKFGAGAITSTTLADGAITAAKIAQDALINQPVNNIEDYSALVQSARDSFMNAELSAFQAANTLGKAIGDNLPVTGDTVPELIEGVDAAVGGLTGTQPRINYEPSIKLVLSSRRDGTYTCDRPVRILPGTFDVEKTIGIDTTKVFGSKVQVAIVGTPTVSGGSITCTELGPRDQYGMVGLDGTATASESRTVDVPLTMDNGDQITARFEIEVGE